MANVKDKSKTEITKIRRYFDDLMDNRHLALRSRFVASSDMYEEDNFLVIEVHLPNFDKKDIKISIADDILEISAIKLIKDEDHKKRNYLYKESSSQYFKKVNLPLNSDIKHITASFKDGLLKVKMPLKRPLKKSKIVPVE